MPAELLFSRTGGKIWGALRSDGSTVELRVEDARRSVRVGRIVKARVSNVVDAVGSAFCDVGDERDGILQGSELVPRLGEEPMGRRLVPGGELLVQIKRESVRAKGDRLSCRIGLPGRFLVYNPHGTAPAVSRRVAVDAERLRLETLLANLAGGSGSFVARTAAKGAPASTLELEAGQLKATWEEIRQRAETAAAPKVLHAGTALPVSFVRDAWAENPRRILLDDRRDAEAVVEYLRPFGTEALSRVKMHAGDRPLLDAEGLSGDIERALAARVPLKSGGHLVIEPTEALVSVDVNAGSSIRGRAGDRTVLAINVEAAREIARQLRLRDLGGIVVIDFIDMESAAARGELVAAFREALAGDPARTRIGGISDLGLMQLTRKRVRAGIGDVATASCPACEGTGRIPGDQAELLEASRSRRRRAASSARARSASSE